MPEYYELSRKHLGFLKRRNTNRESSTTPSRARSVLFSIKWSIARIVLKVILFFSSILSVELRYRIDCAKEHV